MFISTNEKQGPSPPPVATKTHKDTENTDYYQNPSDMSFNPLHCQSLSTDGTTTKVPTLPKDNIRQHGTVHEDTDNNIASAGHTSINVVPMLLKDIIAQNGTVEQSTGDNVNNQASGPTSTSNRLSMSMQVSNDTIVVRIDVPLLEEFRAILMQLDKDSSSLFAYLKDVKAIKNNSNLFTFTVDQTRFLLKEEEKKHGSHCGST